LESAHKTKEEEEEEHRKMAVQISKKEAFQQILNIMNRNIDSSNNNEVQEPIAFIQDK
jgi:hypothetical protein